MDTPSRQTFLNAAPKKTFGALFHPKRNKADFILTLNIVLAVLHLSLAIGFAIYFYSIFKCVDKDNILDLSLYTHYSKCLSERRVHIPDRLIVTFAIAFFAITAFAHLVYAMNYNNFYVNDVAAGGMRWRWLEYSVTATIMIAIIAPLSGVKSLYAYVLIIVACVAIMMTGMWFETGGGVIAVSLGFILLTTIFIVIYSSYLDRVKDSEEEGKPIPGWIKWMLLTTFIFFGCFGFVPLAQMIFGGPFIYYEIVYLILSAASKATLCSFLAYGYSKRIKFLYD